MHHCLLYTWSHTSGLARNGEQSHACVPQHTPNIILGVLLLRTLDIKIAHLVLIFNLVLVLHEVSFMHAKTTLNTLQCLQNELQ